MSFILFIHFIYTNKYWKMKKTLFLQSYSDLSLKPSVIFKVFLDLLISTTDFLKNVQEKKYY